MVQSSLLRICMALIAFLPAQLTFAQNTFTFVALGDLPYGSAEKSYDLYRSLIKRINEIAPAFSIHVGDFKSGSTLCSNEEYAQQRGHLESFSGALIYTPGDNEWADCHRTNNGGYDALERLSKIRQDFFKVDKSLGQKPIIVESQARLMPSFSTYVENLRWEHELVLFTTLHIVGSNNNFESRDPAAVNEFFHRDAANIAWIKESFKVASTKRIDLLVFAFQADIFETKNAYEDFPSWSGFRKSIGETLLPLANQWGKPVLIIHGDSHKFKLDQPFLLNQKQLTNVSRLIVPGANDVRAVKVTVNGSSVSYTLISP